MTITTALKGKSASGDTCTLESSTIEITLNAIACELTGQQVYSSARRRKRTAKVKAQPIKIKLKTSKISIHANGIACKLTQHHTSNLASALIVTKGVGPEIKINYDLIRMQEELELIELLNLIEA